MNYSPKLKRVMMKIQHILDQEDVAGFIVLHTTPHFCEYYNKLNPSYSLAHLDDVTGLIKVSERRDLSIEKNEVMAAHTYNMFAVMSHVISKNALSYINTHELLKEKWGGEDGTTQHTSNTTLNN
jgi:hypothetical protein